MQTKFSSIFSIKQTSSYSPCSSALKLTRPAGSDSPSNRRMRTQPSCAGVIVPTMPERDRWRWHISISTTPAVWTDDPVGSAGRAVQRSIILLFSFFFWWTRKQKSFPSLVDCLRHVASKPLGPGAQYVANSQTVIMQFFVLTSAVQSFPFN